MTVFSGYTVHLCLRGPRGREDRGSGISVLRGREGDAVGFFFFFCFFINRVYWNVEEGEARELHFTLVWLRFLVVFSPSRSLSARLVRSSFPSSLFDWFI